jgi:hypothetical protein
MMKMILFILAGVLLFAYAGKAQILKPVPIRYLKESTNNERYIFKNLLVMARTTPVSEYKSFSIANNYKYTLPQGAIFCRMEDAIYNYLNFWVKFRMGTDDRYSN